MGMNLLVFSKIVYRVSFKHTSPTFLGAKLFKHRLIGYDLNNTVRYFLQIYSILFTYLVVLTVKYHDHYKIRFVN